MRSVHLRATALTGSMAALLTLSACTSDSSRDAVAEEPSSTTSTVGTADATSSSDRRSADGARLGQSVDSVRRSGRSDDRGRGRRGGSDDGPEDDHDGPEDDHDGPEDDHGGHGEDDGAGDDHGRRRGGHGGDD